MQIEVGLRQPQVEVDGRGAICVQIGWWCLFFSDDRELAFVTLFGRFVRQVRIGIA